MAAVPAQSRVDSQIARPAAERPSITKDAEPAGDDGLAPERVGKAWLTVAYTYAAVAQAIV